MQIQEFTESRVKCGPGPWEGRSPRGAAQGSLGLSPQDPDIVLGNRVQDKCSVSLITGLQQDMSLKGGVKFCLLLSLLSLFLYIS